MDNKIMNPLEKFQNDCERQIAEMAMDQELKDLSLRWTANAGKHKYGYQLTWLGRPIIQLPQDIIALQEIIYTTKPDVIIETGVAHGGSLIFYASILELLGHGEVIGIDIDIRKHNLIEIEAHSMFKRITMIEGSSIDLEVSNQVKRLCEGKQGIMVVLDSDHTHPHVLEELRLYSPLVKQGNYLVVMDTTIEDLSDDIYGDRPWGKGNNPKTAVRQFLQSTDKFIVDERIHSKLLITAAIGGYLKCIK